MKRTALDFELFGLFVSSLIFIRGISIGFIFGSLNQDISATVYRSSVFKFSMSNMRFYACMCLSGKFIDKKHIYIKPSSFWEAFLSLGIHVYESINFCLIIEVNKVLKNTFLCIRKPLLPRDIILKRLFMLSFHDGFLCAAEMTSNLHKQLLAICFESKLG